MSIVHRIKQQPDGESPSSSWDMAAEISYKIGIYRGVQRGGGMLVHLIKKRHIELSRCEVCSVLCVLFLWSMLCSVLFSVLFCVLFCVLFFVLFCDVCCFLCCDVCCDLVLYAWHILWCVLCGVWCHRCTAMTQCTSMLCVVCRCVYVYVLCCVLFCMLNAVWWAVCDSSCNMTMWQSWFLTTARSSLVIIARFRALFARATSGAFIWSTA